MSKWAVKRGEYSELFETHVWDIYNHKGDWEGSFLSWRESMDCADEQARTVEIKLPSVARQGMYYGPMFGMSVREGLLEVHETENTVLIPLEGVPEAAALMLAHYYKQKGETDE